MIVPPCLTRKTVISPLRVKTRLMSHCLPVTILFFMLFAYTASCSKSKGEYPAPGGDTTAPVQTDLFAKYLYNPVFNIGNDVPSWRGIHAANVSILTPGETTGGNWLLFMRGSGDNADGYHDNIGTLEQPAATFTPYGPWAERTGNPNLPHGITGTYDARNVLDAAAVTGPGKEIFLYYMSRDAANRSGLCVATSADDGHTFTRYTGNPLKWDVGPNDAVYTNNQYYLFYGDGKWNGSGFDEPLQIWLSISSSATGISPSPRYALQAGSYGSWDSYSVNGAKIFKVSGDNRWFMLYQCSVNNFDYPERFHCAYSTDLIHWTKVTNPRPLLTRGEAGTFDQGAIWTGSVIEYAGALYVYYEGWGSFSNDAAIRDNAYYPGGNSRVGIASCTIADFLQWVNG